MNLLTVQNLRITDVRNGECLVKGLNFSMNKGDCLAIVGESGSGKSLTAKAIMGLNNTWLKSEGAIYFGEKNLLQASEKELRRIRGKRISIILQDGMSAFDPSCTIGVHLRETLREHCKLGKKRADEVLIREMESVLLNNPEHILKKYPHQLSGGMLQRMMIALSLALKSDLIIADEPTTALDTITQYEVVEQFSDLRSRSGVSIIFISHDLGVVKKLADYIIVMRNGEKVEEGTVNKIFTEPEHPYTKYLVETRRSLGDVFRAAMECGHNA